MTDKSVLNNGLFTPCLLHNFPSTEHRLLCSSLRRSFLPRRHVLHIVLKTFRAISLFLFLDVWAIRFAFPSFHVLSYPNTPSRVVAADIRNCSACSRTEHSALRSRAKYSDISRSYSWLGCNECVF